MLKLRDERLHIFKQARCCNYYYRFFTGGKYITRTTRTANLALAKSLAENAYDTFKLTTPKHPAHSFDDAERGLLTALAAETPHGSPTPSSKLRSTKVKLAVLRKFFGAMSLEALNTPKTIEAYVEWRRAGQRTRGPHTVIANKTLRRDFDVLRSLLKFAKREQWIPAIADFPQLRVTPRPGGWFTPQEMQHLLPFGTQWVAQASTPEAHRTREHALLYLKWLVFTGMRVDEALHVRFEDVQIQRAAPPQDPKDCLFVLVRGGKLSYIKGATEMIGLFGAVRAFERLQHLTPQFQPTDRLFPVNPSATIRALLDGAGLRLDRDGRPRTAKSFRHTYIMSRLLTGVDVYVLAQNCRTSVKMIQTHYGSYLNARMKRAELTKLLPAGP